MDDSKTFESLEALLQGHFDKDLADLPSDLRQRVEQERPLLWDDLTTDQRLIWAQSVDYERNPANDGLHSDVFERIVNNSIEKRRHEKDIFMWQAKATPTASEYNLQQTKIADLQAKIDFIMLQERYPGAPIRILQEHHSGTGTTEDLEKILSDPVLTAATIKQLDDMDAGRRKRFEDVVYTREHGQPQDDPLKLQAEGKTSHSERQAHMARHDLIEKRLQQIPFEQMDVRLKYITERDSVTAWLDGTGTAPTAFDTLILAEFPSTHLAKYQPANAPGTDNGDNADIEDELISGETKLCAAFGLKPTSFTAVKRRVAKADMEFRRKIPGKPTSTPQLYQSEINKIIYRCKKKKVIEK